MLTTRAERWPNGLFRERRSHSPSPSTRLSSLAPPPSLLLPRSYSLAPTPCSPPPHSGLTLALHSPRPHQVALQNVLELVGKIDCFICHPAELILEGKGTLLPPGSLFADGPQSRLTAHDITESVLCCVWAVRAIMFPMQRQANGRVMVLGSAPSNAVSDVEFDRWGATLLRLCWLLLCGWCLSRCLIPPPISASCIPSESRSSSPCRAWAARCVPSSGNSASLSALLLLSGQKSRCQALSRLLCLRLRRRAG